MKQWKVILAAALIFASGFVTGALALRAANHRAAFERKPDKPLSPLDARFDALKKMQAELKLTDLQAERIDAILQEGRKSMRQVWETNCQPRVREEMKKVHERIHSELTPEQCARYDQLFRRSKDKDRHGGSRGDGDGHGSKESDGRGTDLLPSEAGP